MKMAHKDKIESFCHTCHSAYGKERTRAMAANYRRLATQMNSQHNASFQFVKISIENMMGSCIPLMIRPKKSNLILIQTLTCWTFLKFRRHLSSQVQILPQLWIGLYLQQLCRTWKLIFIHQAILDNLQI